jgi:hypothetical protein
MKKFILLFLTTICLSFSSFAQTPCITFMGIPVDNDIQTFCKELENKGFTNISDKLKAEASNSIYSEMLNNIYAGEFNGYMVGINVQTIKNKVWRVIVLDLVASDANNIKHRFNRTFNQLNSNSKYQYYYGSKISEDVNIAYETTINGKSYEADFLTINTNGCVKLTICKQQDGYRLALYYENLNNFINGEDL